MRNLRRVLVSLLLTCACAHADVRADQLSYLEKPESQAALEVLRKQPFVVTYCSECADGNDVVLWQLSHVEDRPVVRTTPRYYEITLLARPILRSKQPPAARQPLGRLDLAYVGDPTEKPQQIAIDLAYTYILVNGEWVCLGKFLDLPCNVSVEKFRL